MCVFSPDSKFKIKYMNIKTPLSTSSYSVPWNGFGHLLFVEYCLKVQTK